MGADMSLGLVVMFIALVTGLAGHAVAIVSALGTTAGSYAHAVQGLAAALEVIIGVGSLAALLGMIAAGWRRPLGHGALLAALSVAGIVVGWATVMAPIAAVVTGWDAQLTEAWVQVAGHHGYLIAASLTAVAVLVAGVASLDSRWARGGNAESIAP